MYKIIIQNTFRLSPVPPHPLWEPRYVYMTRYEDVWYTVCVRISRTGDMFKQLRNINSVYSAPERSVSGYSSTTQTILRQPTRPPLNPQRPISPSVRPSRPILCFTAVIVNSQSMFEDHSLAACPCRGRCVPPAVGLCFWPPSGGVVFLTPQRWGCVSGPSPWDVPPLTLTLTDSTGRRGNAPWVRPSVTSAPWPAVKSWEMFSGSDGSIGQSDRCYANTLPVPLLRLCPMKLFLWYNPHVSKKAGI